MMPSVRRALTPSRSRRGCVYSTVSEFQWCHTEMIFHVFTKEGGIWKSEFVADLLNTEICLTQVVTDILQHMFCNPFVSGLARILLAGVKS